MTHKEYIEICGNFAQKYKLDVMSEHAHVTSFIENKEKLFKIIYSEQDNGAFITFHIDLYVIKAISWYTRLLNFEEKLSITDCFIEGDNNTTFLGEEAQKVREMLRLEHYKRLILSEKVASDSGGRLH